uniref:Uncharacterized protein n=1 Tax=Siphoviridae sp. ct2773 TaxID=2826275 RepID=A0A8S5QRT5_9CAUD|nr:MAG TPA: hypothetical protein [Siphoviridae sp. ct2773]
MAKTLIGNIRGKEGRGISKIEKTATTGSVDTYTITYTDGTFSTYELRNSDGIAVQRQIVPSAAIEPSTTASQAYAAGDYVVVNGVLRKVKAAIAKGNAIGDSNSAATTVSGELGSIASAVGETDTWHTLYDSGTSSVLYTKRYDVLYLKVHVRGLGKNWWHAGTLPAKYHPKTDFYAPMYNDAESQCAGVCVESNGQVSLYSYQSADETGSWTIVTIPLW